MILSPSSIPGIYIMGPDAAAIDAVDAKLCTPVSPLMQAHEKFSNAMASAMRHTSIESRNSNGLTRW